MALLKFVKEKIWYWDFQHKKRIKLYLINYQQTESQDDSIFHVNIF